jgi:hypothetical protein
VPTAVLVMSIQRFIDPSFLEIVQNFQRQDYETIIAFFPRKALAYTISQPIKKT